MPQTSRVVLPDNFLVTRARNGLLLLLLLFRFAFSNILFVCGCDEDDGPHRFLLDRDDARLGIADFVAGQFHHVVPVFTPYEFVQIVIFDLKDAPENPGHEATAPAMPAIWAHSQSRDFAMLHISVAVANLRDRDEGEGAPPSVERGEPMVFAGRAGALAGRLRHQAA